MRLGNYRAMTMRKQVYETTGSQDCWITGHGIMELQDCGIKKL